jgi:alpha-tubulin suppressor-like RCC1 family protein
MCYLLPVLLSTRLAKGATFFLAYWHRWLPVILLLGISPAYAQQAVAGDDYSGAIRSDSTLWTWGNNSFGQLGDGTTTERHIPVQVGPAAAKWQSVAAGRQHTVAVRTDGTLWAWGSNFDGQLGDGTTTNRHFPIQVGTNTNWQSVAAGHYHSLGLRKDGTLWAWGKNQYGQLGDGTDIFRNTPVHIGAGFTWLSVAGGQFYTLAVRADGTLWSWGGFSGYALGTGVLTSFSGRR